MDKKVAVVTGCPGQDSYYLTKFLLSKGYDVWGTHTYSSTSIAQRFDGWAHLQDINLAVLDITDAAAVSNLINTLRPHEVYNLAAKSHVHYSFEHPISVFEVDALGPLNILESIRKHSPDTKYYQACYDIETQILTKEGLKSYLDVNIGDLVCTINEETNNIEWKPITKIYEYDYNGDMVHIGGKQMDQLVTPNHEMLLMHDSGKIIRKQAGDLNHFLGDSHRSYYSLPYARFKGKKPKKINTVDSINNMAIEDFLWLCGLYIGDGCIKNQIYKRDCAREENIGCRNNKGEMLACKDAKCTIKKKSTFIQLAISVKDKARKKLIDLLKRNNITYTSNNNAVSFSCKVLVDYFINNIGADFSNKKIPHIFFELDASLLDSLLSGLFYSGEATKKFSYHTSNKLLAEQISLIGILCGFSPDVRRRAPENVKNSYTIDFNKTKKTNKLYGHNITKQNYSGKVWCLEVADNHNFLVMRHGKIMFSGNSTSELLGSNFNTRTKEIDILEYARDPNFLDYGSMDHVVEYYQDETTPFSPNSPYAVAKLAAHNLVRIYRDSYGLWTCSGILHNHTSPMRGEEFVEQKIARWVAKFYAYCRNNKCLPFAFSKDDIALDNNTNYPKLRLGNVKAVRDFSHAADMVEGMWLILNHSKPDDFMLASGEGHTIEEVLQIAFGVINIKDYSNYWVIDPKFYRPLEVEYLRGDPSKARRELGWTNKIKFVDLIEELVHAAIDREIHASRR